MPKNKLQDQVRIIGGKWRTRIIKFPNTVDLRPTPNRVRETLFNWLAPVIFDAKCLDCFAGSGALSFEALSRGAGFCLLVDNSSEVVQNLLANVKALQASNAQILQASFPTDAINKFNYQFDIVFLDPPFHKGLVETCSDWLEKSHVLADECLIYIEAEVELSQLLVPKNWQIIKNKTASSVSYYLIKRKKP